MGFKLLMMAMEFNCLAAILLPLFLQVACKNLCSNTIQKHHRPRYFRSNTVERARFRPVGKLLGYLNADHWAVAMPFARVYPVVIFIFLLKMPRISVQN
jgi:hypothetical protein